MTNKACGCNTGQKETIHGKFCPAQKQDEGSALLKRVKIDKVSGCWLWQGAKCYNGYGRMKIGKTGYQVHRIAYRLFIGGIFRGLVIDHLCQTRNCINPLHLEVVTNAENCFRAHSKSYKKKKTHCFRGHPFSHKNVHISKLGRRRCRKCWRINSRKHYGKL